MQIKGLNTHSKSLIFLMLILMSGVFAFAPESLASGKPAGLSYAHEELPLSVRLGFRMQNRFSYDDFDSDKTSREDLAEFQIRRLRLRLDGVAGHPDLTYTFQFSFTRGDQDWDTINYPNILRDGNVTWTYHPGHRLIFGLRKLPGNRQRVTSSGAQEFVDRSLANATFNIDRDTGIQSWHEWFSDSQPLRLQLALTSGEGRGQSNQGTGLSTTARLEWLPLGPYLDGGDYFEGDLSFETTPKLAIGLVANQNQDTFRLAGQTGPILESDERRDIQNVIMDTNFKFRGWSWSAEYFRRTSANPVISGSQEIFNGTGLSTQLSYTFPSKIALGYRFTEIKPDRKAVWSQKDQNTVGVSYYLNRHSIKIQSDITQENETTLAENFKHYSFRLQFEYGI